MSALGGVFLVLLVVFVVVFIRAYRDRTLDEKWKEQQDAEAKRRREEQKQ